MKLEFENEGRLSALMAARKMRVTPEPELYESHVTICVRHLTLGNKVRLFREGVLFQAVYDWIGSINQTPEFFQLKDHKGITISPDQLIQSGTFNMLACSSPVNMSPNGTVAFLGFGTKNTTLNIIDEDDFHTHEEESVQHQVSSNSKQFDCLQSLREDAYDRLQNGNSYEVSRENIYNEMMTLYKKRNILSHKIFISFVNEDAVGHGVSRDAYSAFFESVYLKMEGFFEKVPMCRFEVEDAETLGKIITHAFICFDMFPIGICKSALKEFLKLEVTDEELFASFLEFLQPNEAELVRRCSRGLIEDVQSISDILFEYSIYTIPNKENVVQLITKAAKIALINTPCYLMQKVVSGMGNFWNKVSSHMISSLYDCTLPTSEKILSNLDANESCNQDQKVVTWLHRYIRCCSKEELQMLLRFVTGSPSIQPNMKIRVEFVDQMAQHLRPCSKTCFKILILPRQYSSFTEMKENLTVYIQNTSNWCVDDNILMI